MKSLNITKSHPPLILVILVFIGISLLGNGFDLIHSYLTSGNLNWSELFGFILVIVIGYLFYKANAAAAILLMMSCVLGGIISLLDLLSGQLVGFNYVLTLSLAIINGIVFFLLFTPQVRNWFK